MNKRIYLLNRAIAFVEMIDANREMKAQANFRLNRYYEAPQLDVIRSIYTSSELKENIKLREDVEVKLINSYNEILQRLLKVKYQLPKITFENAEGIESMEELNHA